MTTLYFVAQLDATSIVIEILIEIYLGWHSQKHSHWYAQVLYLEFGMDAQRAPRNYHTTEVLKCAMKENNTLI